LPREIPLLFTFSYWNNEEVAMYVGVKSVEVLNEYKLLLTFRNNEKKIFDVKPYLNKGIFSELSDTNIFHSVHVSFDTIEWSNGADLCPEVLYREGVTVQT
jgi:hypothetical protein